MFPSKCKLRPSADILTAIAVSEQGLLTQTVHGFQGSLLLMHKISGKYGVAKLCQKKLISP